VKTISDLRNRLTGAARAAARRAEQSKGAIVPIPPPPSRFTRVAYRLTTDGELEWLSRCDDAMLEARGEGFVGFGCWVADE
jgi:hypothetical protein